MMHIEIYIENYLLLNFWMDYLILKIVSKLLQCKASLKRILLGAFLGAICAYIGLYFLFLPQLLWEVLTYGTSGMILLKIGLGLKQQKAVLRGIVMIYSCTFLFGGLYSAIEFQIPGWDWYKAMSITAIGTGTVLYTLITRGIAKKKSEKASLLYDVTIGYGNQQKSMKAMWDSGNRLMEPISKKSVSVASECTMKEIIHSLPEGRLRLIPFYSVGCEEGILRAYRMDYLEIRNALGFYNRIEEPYIGVYTKEVCEEGTYQIILAHDTV